MLNSILNYFHIYYAKRKFMPVGIDWMWDFKRTFGNGPHTIIDVGANIGQTSLALHQRFQESKIHAFEPVLETFNTLVETTKNIPVISTYRLAVSDSCGVVEMKVGENSLTNSVSHSQTSNYTEVGKMEGVECTTLDTFASNQNILRIDLLKVDVEGYEPAVLRGAEGLFNRGAVESVFLEVGFNPSDTGHSYAPEIIRQMYDYGFGFYGLYDLCSLLPPDYISHGKVPTFGNALFLKSN